MEGNKVIGYYEAISYLMGLFGHPVYVYVGPVGTARNTALLAGVLEAAPDFGRVASEEPHEDFREGNTFFWVFVGKDTFVEAELSDDDPPSIAIEQRDGVQLIVEPVKPGSAGAAMFDPG